MKRWWSTMIGDKDTGNCSRIILLPRRWLNSHTEDEQMAYLLKFIGWEKKNVIDGCVGFGSVYYILSSAGRAVCRQMEPVCRATVFPRWWTWTGFSLEIRIPIRAIKAAEPLIALMHFAVLVLSHSPVLFEKDCNTFVRTVVVNYTSILGTSK